jgi:hypothetical protein
MLGRKERRKAGRKEYVFSCGRGEKERESSFSYILFLLVICLSLSLSLLPPLSVLVEAKERKPVAWQAKNR